MKKILLYLVLAVQVTAYAQQQLPPFWNDVQAFKKADSSSMPAKGQTLFIGSSSFTIWKDVASYFPQQKILNRAFGGSTLSDQIRYVNAVVYPYAPKQIFLYCGENDLAYDSSLKPATVALRLKTLIQLIRKKYPNVPVEYVSIKPSPSRAYMLDKVKTANQLIQKWIKTQPNMHFVDVFTAMMNENGTPIETIFGDDRLHMNASGYAIWKQILEPFFLK